MSALKTERLNLRISSEERAAIERRASETGVSVSAYLRRCALREEGSPVIRIDSETLKRIYVNLRRCGGNLNQCAREFNTRHRPDQIEKELEIAFREVAEASRSVSEMIAAARESV